MSTVGTEAAPEWGDADGTVAAVWARGVDKVFEGKQGAVQALVGVDLEVAPGEVVALLGPSGCGKSTLLRVIADLEQPTGGKIAVFGVSPHQARLDQRYGIAFQQAGLLPWRTVAANIALPLQLHGVGSAEREARVVELLELVGLPDIEERFPDQLSGGMQQRVAIARALAARPHLLLMDEPFGALDEMSRERMQDELVRIARATGAAVVLVTHSIPEAAFCADRVAVMSARPGRIAAVIDVEVGPQGRTSALREDPAFFRTVTAIREALHAGSAQGVASAPGASTLAERA